MNFAPKKLFSALLLAIFIGIITLYAYYQSRGIIAGPTIVLATPNTGMVATSSLIAVKGSVVHAKEITLQGRPIFVDLQGRFSEQLLLMNGYNIIELVATDNEGRVDRKTVELVYATNTSMAGH